MRVNKELPPWFSLLIRLSPRIAELSKSERIELVAALEGASFDGIETAGILAGLVGTTYLTQRPPHADVMGAMGLIAWQFGVALVVMAFVLGLMHLRRIRRVTQDFLRRRERHE